MKKLIVTLLALSVGLSLTACKKETQQEKEKIENEHKKGTVTVYLLTEELYYSTSGDLMWSKRYTYDHRGLLTSMEQDSMGYTQIWNEETEVFEYANAPCDGIVDKRGIATYDEQGYLIYSEYGTKQDETGALIMNPGTRYTYQYDARNRPISYSGEYTASHGAVLNLTGYQIIYDNEGRLSKLQVPDENEPTDFVRVEYDNKGRLSSYFIDQKETNYLQTYTYDGDFLVGVERLRGIDEPTQPVNRMEYTYDEHGNFLTKTEYDSYGSQTARREYHHTYESNRLTQTLTDVRTIYYDANGNISRIVYEDRSYQTYSYKAIELTPQQAQRVQMQWDYEQIDSIQWTQLSMPIEFNDCLLYRLLPNPMSDWR